MHIHFHRRVSVKAFIFGLLALLIVTASVRAGSLSPTSSASPSQYTLGDIYTRLTTGATTNESVHAFASSGLPTGSLYTLSQIYNAIPTITPSTVLSGTNYLGIAGTYNAANLTAGNVRSGVAFGVGLTGTFPSVATPLTGATATTDLAGNGTAITSSNALAEWWQSDGTYQSAVLDFPAASGVCSNTTVNGSAGTLSFSAGTIGAGTSYCGTAGTLLQNMVNGSDTAGTYPSASGGVDDANNGDPPAAGRYAGSWTACDSNNNYCSTGDSFADGRDDSTNLIWSLPCNGNGCTGTPAEATITGYTWDNSGANNNSRTAYQLCSDRAGWSLPHQKQLQQASLDGAYTNIESGWQRVYWSATTQSNATTSAIGVYLSGARTEATAKNAATGLIRCIRLSS